MFWFLRGSTDNKELQEQNVGIWNSNASREYLDEIGLLNRAENDLGPIYGHQWRFFNAPYTDCHTDYTGQGYDQLEYIITCLKNPHTRNSRRLIMSAWNPCQLNEMALPPCHILAQFNLTQNKYLSCSMYQRSCDVGLGVPFNIASYSILTHLIAHHCNLEASEFIYYLGNCHIYDDHIEALQGEILREPFTFPTIKINAKFDNIDDYTEKDFGLSDYKSHESITMQIRK